MSKGGYCCSWRKLTGSNPVNNRWLFFTTFKKKLFIIIFTTICCYNCMVFYKLGNSQPLILYFPLSIQSIVHIGRHNFCWCSDSNQESLVLEATGLPTAPQPLLNIIVFFVWNDIKFTKRGRVKLEEKNYLVHSDDLLLNGFQPEILRKTDPHPHEVHWHPLRHRLHVQNAT